ncbi:TetR/AcrR family transcriptional regulator [Gordonia humi]|uniref:AcrR family transcriptional regulator n=1 Tax=Gordonia humi TaxID=686429 RepID=A0A840EU07_9ACTN|nr:AcrR family transcriptional regulator [Gordonia humi]
MDKRRSGSKGVPRAERESQILDAARYEFGTRGYALVHVADVAARAGISKPLVYEYFGSKEGLHAAACALAGARIVDGIATAMTSWADEPIDRGIAVLRAVFAALADRPHDWNVVFDSSLPRGSDVLETAKTFRRRLVGQAAHGIGSSYGAALSDPLDLSALVRMWTATVGALVDWWLQYPETTPDEMAARTERILRALQSPG